MKWLDYGVLETILLYRLGWDPCILAVIERWLLCSGGCLLRFHCTCLNSVVMTALHVCQTCVS